jgi:ubiquinol-cytochrome c reductase cytochrome b subunit
MTSTDASSKRAAKPRTLAGKSAMWVDERFRVAKPLRTQLNKVFPDHWSFMMGEIALYSFIILILTGTYLSFFFDASMGEVVYNGSYVPLKGVEMSRAYASTLHISFDVRGGLVIRQIHHWAALMFIAAMLIHMLRIFFTGAFRKPREVNWLIGLTLLVTGVIEGFVGYSLPDDLLSGTGLRIADAIMLSIPIIGTWTSFLVFGGDFPGTEIIGRFYIVHVLLIPGILAALIGAHLAIMVRQKHTDYPGPGRTEHTVVGHRFFPKFAALATGNFFMVFGILAALGGLAQINPVWLFGPYNPAQVSSGSQPDWYMGMLDGSTRLMPSW